MEKITSWADNTQLKASMRPSKSEKRKTRDSFYRDVVYFNEKRLPGF
ncbi:hypothetical protein ACJROX_29545 [Pseudalkalibacillus sp. A8]